MSPSRSLVVLLTAGAVAVALGCTTAPAGAGTAAASAEHDDLMARARAEAVEPRRAQSLPGDDPAHGSEATRRRQELDDLSERLNRAEQRRNGAPPPVSDVPARRGPGAVTVAPIEGTWGPGPAAAKDSDRVAVLLVMKPGNRGIRRLVKSADPVLCVDDHCYISRGADAPAVALMRRRALGAANTLGARAGACRDRLGCVFRGVRLRDHAALLQPVDLRIVSHDRREPRSAAPDRSCRLDGVGLNCDGAIEAADYTMWIVPEATAERAGASALQAAVAAGLGSSRLLSAKSR